MFAGGTEASINALSVAGFHRMKALSVAQIAADASRPFDTERRVNRLTFKICNSSIAGLRPG